MFKELIQVLSSAGTESEPRQGLREMLQLAHGMVEDAGKAFWGREPSEADRRDLFERDIRLNQLERGIRKQIVIGLASGPATDTTDALLVMSLVKDVERIGDYAKNLAELVELSPDPLPEDRHVEALRGIRRDVERMSREARAVLDANDSARAEAMLKSGRGLTSRCDELVTAIARAEYPSQQAVTLALASRFYKRIAAHSLNVLTSVVMPLHKLDYFDEDWLSSAAE